MNCEKIITILIIFNILLAGIIGWVVVRLNDISFRLAQENAVVKPVVVPEINPAPAKVGKLPDSGSIMPPNSMDMAMRPDGFSTKGIQINAGQKMELTLVNDDSKPHSFNIDELDIKTGPIAPGQGKTVIIENSPAKSVGYQYYSDIDGDKENTNFVGTLMILRQN